MNTISFFHELDYIPSSTAQQRRFTKHGNFLSPEGKAAKALWRAVMEKHAPPQRLEGALRLKVMIVYPHTQKSRKAKAQFVPKITRPDDDNLLKMIKDAMTLTGYWHDDAQTYHTTIERYHGELSGIHISLSEYTHDTECQDFCQTDIFA